MHVAADWQFFEKATLLLFCKLSNPYYTKLVYFYFTIYESSQKKATVYTVDLPLLTIWKFISLQ